MGYIKVIGGYNTDEGNFREKRSIVVDEKDLSVLFRRDYELRELPIIKLLPTNLKPATHFISSKNLK